MKTLDVELDAVFQDFEEESYSEIDRIEAASEVVVTRALWSGLLKDAPGCSTEITNGLSQQLIHQMNLLSPNTLVGFDDLDVELTTTAFPFLQPAAKEALRKAISKKGKILRINSAYRPISQQLFLYNRREGRQGCGYTVVAKPGGSQHQSGLAFDTPDWSEWRTCLSEQGWAWYGAGDEVHFDYRGTGICDIRPIAVKAFQILWNKNHPNDRIAEDGQWGGQTEERLNCSPVNGFAIAPWDEKPRILRFSQPLMQGSDVQKLQQALIKKGEPMQADGVFGPGTAAALKRIQEKLGLKPDGVVGPQTLAQVLGQQGAPETNMPVAPDAAEITPPPASKPEVSVQTEAISITLKQGQVSLEVAEMQTLLATKGCYTGESDGDFGPKTKAAVEAFQRKAGLTADGVAGPQTLSALGYAYKASPRTVDTGLFTVDLVAQIFQGTPRANIEKYLPPVLRALEKVGLGDRDMVLMALATIRAETGSFVPISEYQSKYNTEPSGRLFGKYDFRSDLGNGAVGDGEKYKGRGFVQLTGKANYQKFSTELGLGDRLLNEPELANDPQIAADLLALFLKSKEGCCIRIALARKDYAAARKCVNGGHHGLEAFTRAFTDGLALLKGNVATTCPILQLTTPNMQGEWVRKVQAALKADGIAVAVDSVFGPSTKGAVEEFQQKYGLVADGVVGPKTLKKLGL